MCAAVMALILAVLPYAHADQVIPTASENVETDWFARNWTRAELWGFFEPAPGGGDNEYAYVANRLQAGVRRRAPRYDLTAALQYVQFGGLPAAAVGPGPLGLGRSTSPTQGDPTAIRCTCGT